MKNVITLLLFAIFLISCGKEDPKSDSRDCTEVEYEMSFDVQLEDEVCFPDGNSFIVEDIIYGFCPCDVVCIWAGELEIKLKTTSTDETTKVITIGSTTLIHNRNIFNDYEISEFTYSSIDGHNPECIEDFDPEKVKLDFTISKI